MAYITYIYEKTVVETLNDVCLLYIFVYIYIYIYIYIHTYIYEAMIYQEVRV